MKTCLQGRTVIAGPDYEKPSPEILHLIRKLRWMGLETEAERFQTKLHSATRTGSIITAAHETD